MAKKKEKPEFSYCIGRQWYPGVAGQENNIGVYAYGKDVFYGNIDDAKKMRDFINERCDSKEKYKIYMLVQIPE